MADKKILEQVFNDMKVVDSAGDGIGKVDRVQLADPNDYDFSQDRGGFGDNLFRFHSEAPATVRARYSKAGFFHVDGKGWIDTDRYVLSDEVDRVDGQTVYLNVTKEQLPEG